MPEKTAERKGFFDGFRYLIKMLAPEILILCPNELRPVKDIRENSEVLGASGWTEIARTKIGDVFVVEHPGPLFTITTTRGAILRCSPDHTCFGRFNSLCRHYHIYLMERSDFGARVGMSQEFMKDILAIQSAKPDLSNQTELTERIWILEATESLPHALFLDRFFSFNFGIPNLPFSGRQNLSELSDDILKELFRRIDTSPRAKKLLSEINMFEDFPHITLRIAKSGQQGSSAIQFILFGGNEKPRGKSNYSHLIRIDGNIQLEKADQKQFKRRLSNRGLWHLEVTRDDLEEAQLFVKTLSCLDNLQIVKKIQLTKKSPFYILPASHLKAGMIVPIMGSRGVEEDTVMSVTVSEYKGPMYDLKTEGLFNYIAGDWVVMSFSEMSIEGRNSSTQ